MKRAVDGARFENENEPWLPAISSLDALGEVLGAWLLSALLFAMMSYFTRASPIDPPKDAAHAETAVSPSRPPSTESAEVAAKISATRQLAADLPACARMPLDDACIMRYLRARGMDVAKAGAMLRATIEWRHSFGVDDITSQLEVVKAEGVTGKTFVAPFVDREGRVVYVLRPRNENTGTHTGNIVNLVYSLERISALIRQGRPSKLLLIIDFKGYSMMNAPPMKTSVETLHILQNHYPERLGKAVLLDAPMLFSVAFRAIQPFIDPVTREKINFFSIHNATHLEQLDKLYDRTKVEKELGGTFEGAHFDPAVYFDPKLDPLQAK